MTKAEIENQIRDIKKLMEDSQEKLSELEKMLSEKSNEIPDFPVFDNQPSWAMNTLLDTHDYSIIKCNTNDHNINHDFNLFHDKYFADEFAKNCKFIAMLLHCKWYLCPSYEVDFVNNSDDGKWTVINFGASFLPCRRCHPEKGEVYFDTEENAECAAEWMNEHCDLFN